MQYDHKKIEKKWAEKWVKDKTFTLDLKKAKNPYYALFMFPYPSAEGLHIGNFYAFTCVDVLAKYKKLKGYDVFEPIGFDAFGIHSENYALQIGETPSKMLERTKANFRQQLVSAGLGCDWTREVDTTTPEYYKWTQWIFTKLFEKGLAFQKEALLHWCPSCKTVLADEQIEGGGCERCGTIPEKKKMKQWFFKITDYSQRLLDGLEKMDWSEITKSAQRNWVGKSEGALVKFQLAKSDFPQQVCEVGLQTIDVFTTRPDTLFGATYFVMSPEHKIISNLKSQISNFEEVKKYIKKTGAKSDMERIENKEKTGVRLEGIWVVNPVNGGKIPVWIADYVLMGYGTGAIMAVPAHDQRDWEFAKKYKLPIIEVLKGGNGPYINSGFLDGLGKEEGINKMIEWLEEKGLGKRTVNYKLRDWCISRQRYWGPPIPVVYCEKCGIVPVKEKDLPVLLPDIEKGWEPTGDGHGPLAGVEEFVNTKCPKCGGDAKRETDVMDNFLDSAWYYYRYLSPHDNERPFDKLRASKWLPVDFYVGGNEHAVLHLMYTRFITMALHDLGLIDFDNPFKKFRANGMILKDGNKMSKSKGNVVRPEEYGERVGYDALKTYLLFLGPLSEDRSFSDDGVIGAKRWVEKIFRLEEKVRESVQDSEEVIKKLHNTIKQVEEDFEEQKYNTAIARLMEMTNILTSVKEFSKDTWEKFLVVVSPLTPALAEEMWSRLGRKESIFDDKNWPEYDPAKITEDNFELVVQVNGKFRGSIVVPKGMNQQEAEEMISKEGKFNKYLADKKSQKVIFVKDKLINFVI
ncbi:leucine--tRNA ligase [Patescibacteria group bacterium]|nr:leucine--tRNA ligase [Patescibacteria group bacterium]